MRLTTPSPTRHRATGTPARDAAVWARDLTRTFGDFTAVDAISFEVARGEVFGFLGANGAGKTTAMKMLTGLLAPSSGQAHTAGHDVATEPEAVKRRIGYMSQRFALYDDLTVRENIRFYGGVYGLTDREIADRMDALARPARVRAARAASASGACRWGGSRSWPSRSRCCTSPRSSSSTSRPAAWTRSRGGSSGR